MSGESLYGRSCRVIIQGMSATQGDYLNPGPGQAIEIDGSDDKANPGLRIQFKITKTREKHPNTGEITISNLSPTRRASLQQKGIRVTLEAGYVSTGRTRIFSCDARTVDHERKGADWETVIKGGDGERSFQWARVNESFAAGTGAGDILKRLAQASGLAIGNVPDMVANLAVTFQNGYVVDGLARNSIDRLVKSLGYTWSIQDGALQVLSPGGTVGVLIPEIGPDSGLIGSPEMGSPEKKGKPALVKFKSLLVAVRPGGRVRLKSERYNGQVRLKKVEHEGDTMGGAWYTNMEGVIDAG